MANIRNRTHPQGYTVLDNRGLNCPDISFRATGLWAYVKSKPPNWEININHLSQQKSEGRDAIRKALNELRDAGLVRMIHHRRLGQFDRTTYDFYDSPQGFPPHTEKPDTEKPDTGKPDTGNPSHSNYCNPINTDLAITDGSKQGQDEQYYQWLIREVSDRPDVKHPEKLALYILNQGDKAPEWEKWHTEAHGNDDIYESIIQELTHV